MARSRKKGGSKQIHMCVDRILKGDQKLRAFELAVQENRKNAPIMPRLPGMSMHPMKMALIGGKVWSRGRMLDICFLDGSELQRKRVIQHANGWLKYANVRFNFSSTPSNAEIRISFGADEGSWSYIGTDNLGIATNEPTMNFGWLTDDTDEDEYSRVVLHEFGHALGCIHEHQNPQGGIKWNEEAVYQYFGGPPNNWTREETYENVIKKYSVTQVNGTRFDPKSIMLYDFSGELIQGGKGTSSNKRLSAGDKRYIAKIYPK